MTAVILPSMGAEPDPTIQAVERQTRPPDRILVAESDDATRAQSPPEAAWVWLVDAGVVPEPEALDRLLAAAASAFPVPVLLVSKVLTPDGELDPRSLPVPEVHRTGRVLSALQRNAVAVRVARRGSVLVRPGKLTPSGLRNDLRWTARLLRGELGLLVPASVAVRTTKAGLAPRPRLADSLRLLVALEPRDRLWFAAHLGERALASWRTRDTG